MVQVSEFWTVVQTVPNKEAFAAENLKRQGFKIWLPSLKKCVRHARKTQWKAKPLFPSYIFVKLDADTTRWRSINGTLGVKHVIAFDAKPGRVPNDWIAKLEQSCDPEGFLGMTNDIDIGDTVRVVGGTFENWLGHVIGLSDSDRVTILLDAISRHVPVSMARSGIVKAA